MAETITLAEGESATILRHATDPDGDALTMSGVVTLVNGTAPGSPPAWAAITDNGGGEIQMVVDGYAAKADGVSTFTVQGTADDGTDQTTQDFTFTLGEGLSA